ncbi:hypothetical protein, partial [uncultured Methanofollis sp.]|uniref:hypothetical protein n=1 Tax=uncultured Methanofollis sp. TaxID=262500 RepID=UPI00263259A3
YESPRASWSILTVNCSHPHRGKGLPDHDRPSGTRGKSGADLASPVATRRNETSGTMKWPATVKTFTAAWPTITPPSPITDTACDR